jgi:hypothetical protein
MWKDDLMGMGAPKGDPVDKEEEEWPINQSFLSDLDWLPPLPTSSINVEPCSTPPAPGTTVFLQFPGGGEGVVFVSDPITRQVARIGGPAADALTSWSATTCQGIYGEWIEDAGRFTVRLWAA